MARMLIQIAAIENRTKICSVVLQSKAGANIALVGEIILPSYTGGSEGEHKCFGLF
jgi:hypothetical protein